MARRRGRDAAYATREKVALARALRRGMTPAERMLWSALRRKGLGVRVRAQHVIRGWIVDFYVPAWGLVIEVDGDVHDLQADEDAHRTETLREECLVVMRVRNEAVIGDLPAVLTQIERAVDGAVDGAVTACSTVPSAGRSAAPSPRCRAPSPPRSGGKGSA